MASKNMSDIIEAYLKQLLKQDALIEVQRIELARKFDVVPSQINYVLRTRFKPEQGYLVTTKRGDGGYLKIQFGPDRQKIQDLVDKIHQLPDELSWSECQIRLRWLQQAGWVSKREAHLLATCLEALGPDLLAEQQRAHLMRQTLKQLSFDLERGDDE
ncbi:CtsR family transcriptional regulator [Weissella kandleri]|uniref:CtsR family transcriptional regulator n=1 Tax=Weissella kandleri TaxID=1616 RepID=UPI00387EA2C0